MRAIAILYAGNLTEYAFAALPGGRSALDLALERAGQFPGVERRLLVTGGGFGALAAAAPWRRPGAAAVLDAPRWTRRSLLEALAAESAGFDLCYFAWADAPFLDPALALALEERHRRYAAEYSYADGWPAGLAPELLAPGVAGLLAGIAAGGADLPVDREMLFQVIQKDINAFDIETEISPVDLRQHRISLTCDSKRNFLLCRRFAEAGLGTEAGTAARAACLVAEKPEILRTLPAFYAVQAAAPCPQDCLFCPWPRYRPAPDQEGGGFMTVEKFGILIEKAASFSGDAVIDLSLWGEISLHPERLAMVRTVLERPELSLIIETSGLGWQAGDFEEIAGMAGTREPRPWTAPEKALSWVVSLDAAEEGRYGGVRGRGFAEAVETAKRLAVLFPDAVFAQALRVEGSEDDNEKFYRQWKEILGQERVIIQKYDRFAGALPDRRVADLSPVERRPCWHLMRDMNVLLDGSVPWCREDLSVLGGAGPHGGLAEPESGGVFGPPPGVPPLLGNVFEDGLEMVWERAAGLYGKHCGREWPGLCAECDEYYSFNF